MLGKSSVVFADFSTTRFVVQATKFVVQATKLVVETTNLVVENIPGKEREMWENGRPSQESAVFRISNIKKNV